MTLLIIQQVQFFIRENARKREIAENEIPDVLSRRLLSLRAYNKKRNNDTS